LSVIRLVRNALFAAASIAAVLLAGGSANAETVGNALDARTVFSLVPNPTNEGDSITGLKVIVPQAFTELGTLTTWGLFSSNRSSFTSVTPLIFERDALTSQFTITGVGTNREHTGTTVGRARTFDFALIAGSAEVGPGKYFGFHQGSSGVYVNGAYLAGSSTNSFNFIDYDQQLASPAGSGYLYHTLVGTSVSNPPPLVGLTLTFSPFADSRIYSLDAISAPVPEPSAMALAGIGLFMVAARLRRARRSGR
jgi:hypothetical protein